MGGDVRYSRDLFIQMAQAQDMKLCNTSDVQRFYDEDDSSCKDCKEHMARKMARLYFCKIVQVKQSGIYSLTFLLFIYLYTLQLKGCHNGGGNLLFKSRTLKLDDLNRNKFIDVNDVMQIVSKVCQITIK